MGNTSMHCNSCKHLCRLKARNNNDACDAKIATDNDAIAFVRVVEQHMCPGAPAAKQYETSGLNLRRLVSNAMKTICVLLLLALTGVFANGPCMQAWQQLLMPTSEH
jgi:hypothetical protein